MCRVVIFSPAYNYQHITFQLISGEAFRKIGILWAGYLWLKYLPFFKKAFEVVH